MGPWGLTNPIEGIPPTDQRTFHKTTPSNSTTLGTKTLAHGLLRDIQCPNCTSDTDRKIILWDKLETEVEHEGSFTCSTEFWK